MSIKFVYDRVQADVDYVYKLKGIGWAKMTPSQRAEWMEGLKGCLNTCDLIRIENAISIIAQLLQIELQTRKDNIPELPDADYFQKLLENVSTLRESGYLHADTPTIPMHPINTYLKLNDIEHILHDIYEICTANNNCLSYCGEEIYTGDEIGIL